VHAKVGDTVVWTNADDQDHTVIAGDGSFNSGNIGSGRSFEHKFTRAGTFGYYCKYHPRMKGSVIVATK
jgi:plastocyanin